MALHTIREGATVHCSWQGLCQMDRRSRDMLPHQRSANQRSLCEGDDQSGASIMTVFILILIISCRDGKIGRNTMKSANKRRQTLHHPSMFIFTLFMLMYTDIRYPLFLFHSLPEFVPKMYLWRIFVIDGNKRRWLIWRKSGIYRTFILSFQNHL